MNISDILKNSNSTNCILWSPLFGICSFDRILSDNKINIKFFDINGTGSEISFFEDGTYFKLGECVLFPSKRMRDWEKYAWKKGDILFNGVFNVIFKNFTNNEYTEFRDDKGQIYKTSTFHKITNMNIFKPYDKVLVRDTDSEEWTANFFSHYIVNNAEYPFACINDIYKQCIPFDINYLGTIKAYEED